MLSGLAELPGPVFWHLDGSGMDDDFAFEFYHRTREDWEAERRKWDEFSRRFTLEQAVQDRLGIKDPAVRTGDENVFWWATIPVEIDGSAPQSLPIGRRLFAAGSQLAKMIVDLEELDQEPLANPNSQRLVQQLEQDFTELRECLQSPKEPVADTIVRPKIDRLIETLSWLESAESQSITRSSALAKDLHKLLDPESSDTVEHDFPF